MNTYITSDLHFEHKNIMKFNPETRPYTDMAHMNESMVREWNEIVTEDGQLHRVEGPAAILPDGKIEWHLNDKRYSFQEWTNELNLDQKTRLEMVIKWNPE